MWSAETMLKLREATDPIIGINLDPSHMMVLGADPIAAARALKGVSSMYTAKMPALSADWQIQTAFWNRNP